MAYVYRNDKVVNVSANIKLSKSKRASKKAIESVKRSKVEYVF